jgi:hypothetical protein
MRYNHCANPFGWRGRRSGRNEGGAAMASTLARIAITVWPTFLLWSALVAGHVHFRCIGARSLAYTHDWQGAQDCYQQQGNEAPHLPES